jgi:hypothetical protein
MKFGLGWGLVDNMVEQNKGLFIKEEDREGCNMFFGSEQGGM